MPVQRALAVLVAALAFAACSQLPSPRAVRSTDRAHRSHPAPSTSTTTPRATSTSAPPTSTTVPPPATRTFSIAGADLTNGSWLTVGLHPTTAPIQIRASAATPLEVCPAGLDGSLADSSWAPWFDFPSCKALSSSGTATLPSTDGMTHVAFALKPAAPSPAVPLALTISYTPTDSFVEVIPPDDGAQTGLTVTYTPGSGTTGAEATRINSVEPAPGYVVVLSQAGRIVSQPATCDFPAEIPCVGAVTPGVPISARLSGPAGSIVLSLVWK
jgi:hypothetical protein